MFETLLQLFEVSIELKKIGDGTGRMSSAPTRVNSLVSAKAKKSDDDISVIHETKPKKIVKTTFPTKAQSEKKGVVIKSGKPDFKTEAFKRKKLALTRLRDRNSESRFSRNVDERPEPRMNAASFMNNDPNMFSNNMLNNMDQSMMSNMGSQMNNMNNMDGRMNNMNNQMNDQMANMMMNNMMNMVNNQPSMGMMMMDQGMNNINSVGGGMDLDLRNTIPKQNDYDSERRDFRAVKRSSVRGRPVRGVGGRSLKGPVMTRLGFKSNITVDPTLLDEGNVNEEDY